MRVTYLWRQAAERRKKRKRKGNEKETLLLLLLFLQEQELELMVWEPFLETIFFFFSFCSFDCSITPNAGVHIQLWRGVFVSECCERSKGGKEGGMKEGRLGYVHVLACSMI